MARTRGKDRRKMRINSEKNTEMSRERRPKGGKERQGKVITSR